MGVRERVLFCSCLLSINKSNMHKRDNKKDHKSELVQSDLPFSRYREKCAEKGHSSGVYGKQTQIKCLIKALIFDTCKNNTLIYSQVRFFIDET